jgi:hypothetical protein
MVLKRGRGKPKRGGSHRFSSSHDPNAYITSRTSRPKYEENEEESEGNGSEHEVAEKLAGIDLASKEKESDSSNESESVESDKAEEEKAPESLASAKKDSKPAELTRKQREAIEKERAREHFLKMKAKEESERLAIIRKQREEAAAAHAASIKLKEDARLARRSGA